MNDQSSAAPPEIGDEPRAFASASLETQPPTPPAVSSSLTYEPFYGLDEKPFSLSSDPRFLYRSPTHAPAFEDLLNGIRRREGLIVLTGEIGTGKTTLIRSVLQHLDRRTFTAFVPDPFVSREDLLKMLLVDFGVVSVADLKRGSLAGASRPELSYPLYEFLDSLVPLQAFAVLIVDEAQNLPLPLLEEIRVLSDLEQREKLLQVVLVGQPELRSNMKLPEMRQVDQRVSVRCELSPLGREEVATYISHRLAIASHGTSRVEFSETAVQAVFDRSGGVPRLINLICDRSLHRGHAAGTYVISPVHVEEAIAALRLPAPAPVATATTTSPAVRDREPRTETVVHVRVKQGEAPAPSQSSARPVRPVGTASEAPPLSEFAAEADLTATPPAAAPEPQVEPERDTDRGAEVAAPSRRVASLIAAAIAATALVFAASRAVDLSAALPPAPAWMHFVASPTLPPAVDDDPGAHAVSAIEPSVAGAGSDDEVGFAIQVASFQSRARADRLVQELTAAGLQARAVEFDLGPPLGRVMQVRIDGYKTEDEAGRDLTRIRELPGYADARLLAN